ncbi:MAG TPA: cholesterol oxidase substrate-binding domain-containing protein, partial [Pseudomonadales bacterium]|nr:cholesterol oxidase substrate-binding domain-containing protein [Pseudomonadales bacterium]
VAAWGVMTSRANIQRVLHEFYVYFKSLIQTFTDRGLYPYAGPVELRAHGVDNPAEVLIANAVEPTISGPRPHPDYPERDVIIWFAINNNVDQPLASEFNTRLEEFFLSNYQSYAIVRPEWTKSYAFTADGAYGGAWTNTAILTETFPNTWRDGYPANDNWDFAVATLTALDPHRIFSNSHLDKLFPI